MTTLHLPEFLTKQRADSLRQGQHIKYFCRVIKKGSTWDTYCDMIGGMKGLALRGAFDELCAIAFQSEPRDVLCSSNGQPISEDLLAHRLRVTGKEWAELRDGMIAGGVLDVVDNAPATQDCNADAPQADPPAKKQAKGHYGEMGAVRLTDEQHAALVKKHGKARAEAAIEVLDTYIASKGDKYKDHNAVFKANSWVWERVSQQGIAPSKPALSPQAAAIMAEMERDMQRRGAA